jgi:hypothetical protein
VKEPIILGLAPAIITGLITALANVLRAFGLGDITKEQIDALNAAALALMLVLSAVGAWWARERSTPTASPTLDQGTVVTVVTPPGEANRTTTL